MQRKIVTLLLAGSVVASILTGCGVGNTAPQVQNGEQNTQNNQTESVQNSQGNQGQSSYTSGVQSQQPGISQEEAKSIALNQAGITETDTIGLTVRQDFDDGFQFYEVNLYTPNMDYEYEISKIGRASCRERVSSPV